MFHVAPREFKHMSPARVQLGVKCVRSLLNGAENYNFGSRYKHKARRFRASTFFMEERFVLMLLRDLTKHDISR